MVFDEATADHYIMSPEDRREAAFMPHRELQTETGALLWGCSKASTDGGQLSLG